MVQGALRFGLISLLVMTFVATVGAPAALAGTLIVNIGTGEDDSGNGQCSLVEAILRAQGATSYEECGAADDPGPDTIILNSDVTLTQEYAVYTWGPTGLPMVTTEISILAGSGSLIQRDTGGSAPPFRIFEVRTVDTAVGDLTLEGITITGGRVGPTGASIGGAFVVGQATLRLIRCQVTNNHAAGSSGAGSSGGACGGAIWQMGGTLVLDRCTVSGNSVTGGSPSPPPSPTPPTPWPAGEESRSGHP